jgi:hypothetical protein
MLSSPASFGLFSNVVSWKGISPHLLFILYHLFLNGSVFSISHEKFICPAFCSLFRKTPPAPDRVGRAVSDSEKKRAGRKKIEDAADCRPKEHKQAQTPSPASSA